MQIKKYVAATLKDAIEEMKAELGDEAIVLSTRVLEGRGPRSQTMFEITAGLDTPGAKPLAAPRRPQVPQRPVAVTTSEDEDEPAGGNTESMDLALEELRKKIFQARNAPAAAEMPRPAMPKNPYTTQKPSAPAEQPLLKAPAAAKPAPAAPKPSRPAALPEAELPATEPVPQARPAKRQSGASSFLLENIKHSLLEKDIQPTIVSQLMGQLTANVPFMKPADIDSSIISTIATMIPTSGFEINKRKSGKIVSVVGPTGVGKTTCIAKLAVISKLLHKLDIGLISVDTYRLGAIDQLKIFSEISDIDFLVAYEAKDLPGLVNKFKHKDIIFLDTAGRSQNNAKHLKEMQTVLSTVSISETILVLSATHATSALLDIAKKFTVFNYNGIIFTKLDEAVTYGNILNVVHKFGLPIKYLTNGQVIPDDIIAADSDHVANIIYSGKVTAS